MKRVYSFTDIRALLEAKDDLAPKPPTEAQKTKEKQSKENQELQDKHQEELEKAREEDFRNKEQEKKKDYEDKQREKEEHRKESEAKKKNAVNESIVHLFHFGEQERQAIINGVAKIDPRYKYNGIGNDGYLIVFSYRNTIIKIGKEEGTWYTFYVKNSAYTTSQYEVGSIDELFKLLRNVLQVHGDK